MAAMNYRGFYEERIFDKTLFIEMNDAAGDMKNDLSSKAEITQKQTDTPCIQGLSSIQGSVLSLATRSIIDQSDVQPLTDIHVCRYDECTKFHDQRNKETEASPASLLKHFFFFLLIGLLILWIITYSVLNRFEIL